MGGQGVGATDRRWTGVAWTVLTVTAVLTVASVVAWAVAAPPWHPWLLYSLVDLMMGVVYGVVAWLMLLRGGHLVAWIMAAAGLGGTFSAAVAAWSMVGSAWPVLMPSPIVLGAMYWLWIPGFYALMVVLPWLLPIRRTDRVGRIAIVVGVVFIVVAQLSSMTDPGQVWTPLPLTDPTLRAVRQAVDPWLRPTLILLTVAAAAGVLRRRRRAVPAQRPGLGWLAVGLLLLALATVPLALNATMKVPVTITVVPLLMLAAQAFYPAAVLVVALRQRLWGLELSVRRALVWGLMTSSVIGAYTLGVVLLDAVLPTPSVLPEVLVTAVVAASFQPLRQWVQRRVDRLVHGDTGHPLIRQVADRLRTADRGEQMLGAVADGIATSLRLAAVTVATGDTDPAPPGQPVGGEPVVVHLTSDGRPVGVLRAWPRPGERLGRRAASILADLAPMVTALVELAAAQDELDRSRSRTAQARDEERRRLRRDLHDELGPALSGLGLGLAAGRNMLRDHRHVPAVAAADQLIGRLAAEADRQAAAVRDLARDLMPPLLDDGALTAALDQLRERYEAAGLTVAVQAAPLRLPDGTAVAVYGIVAEAVRNVHRHAGVDQCMISVVNGPDGLEVSVTDHGVGIDDRSTVGVGTRSMHERAAGIGARLTIGAVPGAAGTHVHLVVPAGQP